MNSAKIGTGRAIYPRVRLVWSNTLYYLAFSREEAQSQVGVSSKEKVRLY
jgi:hypothetical protein